MNDYIETTFEFQGNTYPLRILTGSVIDTNARSDTHVSGGGSYTSGNRTHVSAVTSHVEITQNLWLRCASGKERHLEFKTDFPVRAGHVLQIAFLVGYNDDDAAWVSFDNITTGKGWTRVGDFVNAKTTSQNLIWFNPHRSPFGLFWLVKYPLLTTLVYVVFDHRKIYLDLIYPPISLSLEPEMFISAFGVFGICFFYRVNLSRKNLSPAFKNAAIAKYNAIQTQRAEAVEQLKASLSEPQQNQAIAPVKSYRSGSGTISEG